MRTEVKSGKRALKRLDKRTFGMIETCHPVDELPRVEYKSRS